MSVNLSERCDGQYRRHLGFSDSAAIIIGSMVGVGIFLTPSEVARASPDIFIYMGFWVLGGISAMAGSLVYAELGSMFPRAGGDYIFLDEAFGRGIAFAWGWLSFLAAFSGSIAALAVGAVETIEDSSFGGVLGTSLFQVWGKDFMVRDIVSLFIVWTISLINCAGARLSARVQMAFAWTPILIFLSGGIYVFFGGGGVYTVIQEQSQQLHLSNIMSAFCAVFFAFSGWNVLTYVGGEVKSPSRTIPLATISSVFIVTIAYLLINLAFLTCIPLDKLSSTPNAGVTMAHYLFGSIGADIFSIILAVAIIASLNVATMAGSRIWNAMARHGYLWTKMGEVHGKRNTPIFALLVQGLWTSILVLTGSFSFLITFTGSVMLLLSCLTVASIFVLRRKKGIISFYRSPWYPVLPLFYLLVGITVIIIGVISDGLKPLFGLAIFFMFLFIYWARKGLVSVMSRLH